ncbi:heparinase II/III domain-containing protein [Compostibacter hankyongensis]|uniref:Heparinase II/III family protein n=1 Tax=Compostibacter hankyongensis TaxID=1007089 RepID=A0ABP8FD86_9BACT
MRKRILLWLIAALIFSPGRKLLAQRNWLAGSTTETALASGLAHIESWRKTEKENIRQLLGRLPDTVRQTLISRSEKDLDYAWPNLPATVFLQFGQNGNRTNYQNMREARRRVLNELVIGELLERKGRFIPQIVNGVWAICEESTWAYPAHLSLQKKYSPLPYPGEDIIDLGAATTSSQLAWIWFLLKDTLAAVSPVIPGRIVYELERRIVTPYLGRDDFWWMGLHGQSVNNWNPWVNGNVLLSALLVEKEDARLTATVYKTMQSVDKFINQYPEDGGCDEGPSYWTMAGGALIRYLQWLDDATAGKVRITDRPLIGNMGRYIYKLNIGGNAFVDFADAHPETTPDITAVFTFGQACRDEDLKSFAAYFASQDGSAAGQFSHMQGNLDRFISYLQIFPEIQQATPRQPLPKTAWLPDLQVLTVRRQAGSAEGLFLAAKGGTNDESHNHNDVGNFIIYADGKPAVIDIGVGTYTRQTFSKDRYKIFTMQSAWHNLPTINGVMQRQGKDFRARNVHFSEGRSKTALSMDISGAYPEAAGVDSWIRSLTFGGDRITLREKYALKEYKQPFTLSLITPLQATVKGSDIILKSEDNSYGLKIRYDPRQFEVKIEDRKLDDPSLIHAWGSSLRRLLLISRKHDLKGGYSLVFEKG